MLLKYTLQINFFHLILTKNILEKAEMKTYHNLIKYINMKQQVEAKLNKASIFIFQQAFTRNLNWGSTSAIIIAHIWCVLLNDTLLMNYPIQQINKHMGQKSWFLFAVK
jgi:hypothetical protein